jgi:hypothetical protein
MTTFIRPLLAPRVRSLKEVPMALLQVALFGAMVGPLIGLFFGWLILPAVAQPPQWVPFTLRGWLVFAAPVGTMYSLVFYSVFGLAIPYICRRYQPSGSTRWLLGLTGWTAALLILTAIPAKRRMVRGSGSHTLDTHTDDDDDSLRPYRDVPGCFGSREGAEGRRGGAGQVKALQAQINPHFYFNTLNTI